MSGPHYRVPEIPELSLGQLARAARITSPFPPTGPGARLLLGSRAAYLSNRDAIFDAAGSSSVISRATQERSPCRVTFSYEDRAGRQRRVALQGALPPETWEAWAAFTELELWAWGEMGRGEQVTASWRDLTRAVAEHACGTVAFAVMTWLRDHDARTFGEHP